MKAFLFRHGTLTEAMSQCKVLDAKKVQLDLGFQVSHLYLNSANRFDGDLS